MIFKNIERIVFAGDSVTDIGSVQPVGEGLFENLGSVTGKIKWTVYFTSNIAAPFRGCK